MATARGEDKRPRRELGRPGIFAVDRARCLISQIDDARLVPASRDKAQQIVGRYRGRAVVCERMVVERIVVEHLAVEHRGYPMSDIVDQRERRDTAGQHPEQRIKIAGAKRKPRRTETGGKLVEVEVRAPRA